MQCYTELLPPSGVTHAASLPFTHANVSDLVVAKTCLLQIFRLQPAQHPSALHQQDAAPNASKLVLVGEYPLSGTVTSLQPVKGLNAKSGGDSLLIAFKDAKLSLIEWDPDNHRIGTVSIHSYEGENIIHEPFGPSLQECTSILTVDPNSRCAALKFAARKLAILPFRQSGEDFMEGVEDGAEHDEAAANLQRSQSGQNENALAMETSYRPSFVMPMTALLATLTHPVDLAFLHDTREPTFGILAAAIEPSSTLLEERKDALSFNVVSIDPEPRDITYLGSIEKLPSDLWKVVPLPPPIKGALLVGTNELVHVDQAASKASAVAVNEFARLSSDLAMRDQSDLNMKLEGCVIHTLDAKTGDLLLALKDCSYAVLSFQMLGGHNVGGLRVTPITAANGGSLVEAAPSCTASLDIDSLFVGSEDGPSVVLSWSKPVHSLSRKRSHAQMLGRDSAPDDDAEADDLDDDDLYAATTSAEKPVSPGDAAGLIAETVYRFRFRDRLSALGPINNTCLGRPVSANKHQLELLAGVGRGPGSCLALLSRDIIPAVVQEGVFPKASNAWSVGVGGKEEELLVGQRFDTLMFCYDGEGTRVYDIKSDPSDPNGDLVGSKYEERTSTEFEYDGETIEIGVIANGTHIVQCKRDQIRTYQSTDLALVSIVPMVVDETDPEVKIVHVSISDPYVLVIRDDSSIMVLQVDNAGDLDAIENSDAVNERKWQSGCLYSGVFGPMETVLAMLGEEGGLHMFSLPDLQPFYTAPALSSLPAVLSSEPQQRRAGGKETLAELLLADVGTDEAKQPYLVVRSAMDDLTLYEPWSNDAQSWRSGLRFRKVQLSYVPRFDETSTEHGGGRPRALTSFMLGKYSVVTVHGPSPSFIIKEATSLPKIIGMRTGPVAAIVELHRSAANHGFGLLVDGVLTECTLPLDIDFSTGWSIQKLALGGPGEEVRHISFHEDRQMYVVATCRAVDFNFPEDDGRHHEQDATALRPKVPQYTLHLMSSATRQIIHSVEMPYLETITSLKVMPLEISEQSHEVQLRIVVGTAAQRGEDSAAKGTVNVFEILSVVPEPDRPESGVKLQLVSREETKGAVTAVESFPGGLIGTAQGQKLMIRGLKEDGSCLPVAFLDAQCYTTTLKQLSNSGLWLAADAWKGLWFGGFTQEPYKLTTLGKSRTRMEVVAAEFLPFDGQLFLMVIDANMDLIVLQYDPENPKTLSGTRLLKRSTFHLGQFASGTALLPSTLAPAGSQPVAANGYAEHEEEESSASKAPALQHVLVTSHTGSVGLITPVDEATYRRLGALQTHLTSVLEHAAGLNPRAYRAVESEGFGSRGVIDGSLIKRIGELGSARRAEVLARAGSDVWALRSDLEIIGGGGLSYL